ncbi:ephrin type-A receptor 3-like isoform X2 [Paramacrobiotus metropolitanus]|uniref:ephrin type-A receptor 3-like isoform X2 n=1 Tax=Paramacrobiotus metropolitanus TaxID=2943436 RepID=UPI0024458769|nr:ephrin type-A receptor 3-like isoform X2 [Paramacrobiotus metropolitanus]
MPVAQQDAACERYDTRHHSQHHQRINNNLSTIMRSYNRTPSEPFFWKYALTTLLLLYCILNTAAAKAPVIPVLGRQVILLDTTQEAQLGWMKLPPSDVTLQTQGWLEESYTHFEHGINWRSYVACDVAYDNVNNWLWTPYIDRQDGNRLFIEVKFSMRDCSLFPGKVRSCKETFSLLYHEVTDPSERSRPPTDPDAYTLIDRIAADKGRFTSNNDMVINMEVRDIPLSKNAKGVYFAFQDQGACISVLAVKVYYITCPNVTINSAVFPETPTGPDVASIAETFGQCLPNSVQIEPPKYLCKSDGSWYYMTGSCLCMPGTERVQNTCKACPVGKYKTEIGDGSCLDCPEFSTSNSPGAAECRCQKGFFRAPSDTKSMACSQPPSAPQNVTVETFDQTSIVLKWNRPLSNGGRSDVVYRIGCDICGSTVMYSPSQSGFNGTRVRVTGLKPHTRYFFTIYSENGVSELSQEAKYERISVTTAGEIPADTSLVLNVQAEYLGNNKAKLMWHTVSGFDDNINLYEIQYAVAGTKPPINVTTMNSAMLFDPLISNTEYNFRVRARSGSTWGPYSDFATLFTNAEPVMESQGPVAQVGMIAGITVALILCVVLFGIMFYMFWKRNNDGCGKKQASDCDTLEYRHAEIPFDPHHPHLLHPIGMGTPVYRSGVVPRTYVDPHTYEDPTQAVRDFTRELDPSLICIDAVIGGGEFGDVCRGTLLLPNKCSMTVAIKTLNANHAGSNEKAKADFLMEATIMGQFDHSNVIYLQGIVTRSNPVMIVTEYMENGSLDAFLRANVGSFQSIQMVHMLRGIAAGMNYLASKNYVHRDLAARNVLVNKNLICKIADFGLSREIESCCDAAYTTKGGKIPVRWTAPEAIQFRKFTTASDVWSFGIVCWEVMSYGERPYWNWSNQDVIKSIDKGYRLPPPMKCPDLIYQLMLECWQHELLQRPTFGQCLRALDKMIRSPSQLSLIAQNGQWGDHFGDDSQEIAPVLNVEGWLDSLGLSCYVHHFAGINSLDALARLSPDDLSRMGSISTQTSPRGFWSKGCE